MPITVKHGSKKKIPLMKALWKDVFGDSDEFIDTFFEKFYRPSRTLLAFDGNELVSMLYYMDIGARYSGKKYKCAYLYGVATKFSERGQGYFKQLHSILLDELRTKHYDGIAVIPASERLFGLYRDVGYTLLLRRFEYKLFTADIEETNDLDSIWLAKKQVHRKTSFGLSLLESLEQFKESRRDHKFFRYGSSYLCFAPTPDGYVFYEKIEPDGEAVPSEQTHYKKSALLYDLSETIDPELIEKQKPRISYLLN